MSSKLLELKTWVKFRIHRFKIRWLIPMGLYDTAVLKGILIPEWEVRIDDVISCPDNEKIKRVSNAGLIQHGKQIMHNGIPITAGGYYGSEIAQMLLRNRGVHEPQEEFAFDLVVQNLRPGAVMVELGCYWCFYSIWFLKTVVNGKSFLVEPDMFNLEYGKNNFRINNLVGDFTNAFVASKSYVDEKGSRYLSVPDLMRQKGIDFIDVLHSDIQGQELDMLLSMKENLMRNGVGYLFISTHSNELHYRCLDILKDVGYTIVCHADIDNSFSYDGLIVAKSLTYPGVESIEISKRK